MAGSRIQGITIEIGGETTKLQSALKKVNTSLRDTSSKLKDVDRLLKLDPKNVDLLQQKQKLLGTSIQDTAEKLKTEQDALAQLKGGPQTEETIRQQENLTREIAATEQSLNSLEGEYKDFGSVAKQQAEIAAEKMKKCGESIQSAGKKMRNIGAGMTAGVTTPIIGAGVATANMAMDFEDAMAKVSTIADETEVSMEDMTDAILGLSDETGIASTDIADNVYNAISAGQKTGDAVNFVSNATKLAKAGFTDSASALDVLTTTLNAYGLKADEVGHVSDVLIMTQNLGKTTVGELAASMGKIIPTAKANGVELEQLAGAYAVMTSNGIATAESTTYMNSMLNELGKQGTAASKTFAKGTEDIQKGGLTMSEAMEKGWSLTDVLKVLGDQAEKNGTSVSNMFGSAEAGKAANVLLSNSQQLNSAINTMGSSAGATDDAFAKLDTQSYEMQITLNQLKNTGMELGSQVLVAAAPLVQQVSEGVSELCTWFKGLDDDEQQQIIKIGGIVAAAGPLIMIGGLLVNGIGHIVSAGSGLITGFGSLIGKMGGLSQSAGTAVNSVSSLGTAASSAAAPVSSAGGAVGTLSQNALGLVAAGAGIVLASAGLYILAKAAIQIAEAGPGAAVALVALVAAVAGMAVGAAALAPALAAGSAGLIAFGAGITLVGAGIFLATSGVALLASQIPKIATSGEGAASAIVKISNSLTRLALSAGLTTAAVVAMLAPFIGAAATIGATDLALIGFSATLGLSMAAATALGVAMLAVSAPVESIKDNATTAGTALTDMVTSVNVVETSLDGLVTKLGDAAKKFAQIFTDATPTASAQSKLMVQTVMSGMLQSTLAGTSLINNAWTMSMDRLNTTSRSKMMVVENTIQEYINRIKQMFSETQFSFNQSIKLPHFSMNGEFNPQTGSTPQIGVNWYRKAYDDAYVLNGATIFGAMNGRMLGGGEGNGSEMIIGTNKLLNMIAKAQQSGGSKGFTQNLTINAPTELSPAEVARQTKNANRQMVLALRGL